MKAQFMYSYKLSGHESGDIGITSIADQKI